jgi:hypothetical protein
MVQEAGIPESQAMLISGHETQTMLERYNIVSLKHVKDAGAKLTPGVRGGVIAKLLLPANGFATKYATSDQASPPATLDVLPGNPDFIVVRTGRVELPFPCGSQILSLVRLPIPPRSRVQGTRCLQN